MTDETPPPKPKKPRTRKPATNPDGTPKARAPRKKVAAEPKVVEVAPPRQTLWAAVITTGLIIAVDQLLKWIVVHALRLKDVLDIEVWEPWLNLRMAWNQGMNFGLFSSQENVTRWVLIVIALVVCAWVTVWLMRARPGRWAQIAAGLLIGGALGNVIDRFAYGAVADFLNMSLPGWRNPYSFNVADIAIFAGAIGLVFLPSPADGSDKTRDEAGKTG